jgi:hypothetical protein
MSSNRDGLESLIEKLKDKLVKLNEWETAANFKGGYQPAINEYTEILGYLESYNDSWSSAEDRRFD